MICKKKRRVFSVERFEPGNGFDFHRVIILTWTQVSGTFSDFPLTLFTPEQTPPAVTEPTALPSFWNADPDKYPRKLGLSEWLYRARAKPPGNPSASLSALKRLPSDRTAKRSSPTPLLFNFERVLVRQERRPCWQRQTIPSLIPTRALLLRDPRWQQVA